ncbi:MAG: LytTR family DNA-binding domain-containing protein [Burkholderiaceae bacterium]
MLPSLRVLIVDDEELARLRLRGLVDDCADPAATVVGEAASAAQALAWLATSACDVLLLDVQMPGRDGTQLAAELRLLAAPPAVVFVTAHAQHALHAFDLEAVDFLTKPVRRERLHMALKRVEQRVAQRVDLPRANGGAEATALTDQEPVLVATDRGRVLRVALADVLYFKAELKYVTLRTADQSYVLDEALSDLEQRLGERFLRVHRNALVARSAVRALERRTLPGEGQDEGLEAWAVCVAPVGEWLAVSRRQVTAVRDALTAAGR